MPANTWSFLTETYDGSTVRLYVNGTQVASTAHTGAIATSTNPLQIGGDSIYGQFFAGLIDNVRVYNTALSAAQIQADQTTAVTSGPDTTAPSQPGTLTATVVSGGEVDLSWGASTDNVGVTGYLVERCQGAGCTNFAQIASPTGTTYKDTSVSASTSYSYRRPRDRRSWQPEHVLEYRRRYHPDARYDAAVAAGDAVCDGCLGGEVDLSWGASTDNVGVTGYQVERCQGASCTNFAQIATSDRYDATRTRASARRRATATASARPTQPAT